MRRGRVVRARRLSDRRRRDPDRRGRRHARRPSRRRPRRSRPRPREPHAAASASPPTRPNARCCGRDASPRSARSRRSRRTTTCTTAWCRGRKLVEVLTGVYEIAERHDLIVTNVFHAGDGNLHPLLSFDRGVPGTLERVLRASEEIVRLCVDAGGALSRRARHRAGEARLHAAGVHGRGPRRAGVRAVRVRPRRADEPAEGAAGRRPVRRLRDGARLGRRGGRRGRCRRAHGSDPPAHRGPTSWRRSATRRDRAPRARRRRAAARRQGQPGARSTPSCGRPSSTGWSPTTRRR